MRGAGVAGVVSLLVVGQPVIPLPADRLGWAGVARSE
jgi:hypothetical protein